MPVHKKCRQCRFRAPDLSVNGCDYLLITGRMRGCPPGDACTRFVGGKRMREKVRTPPPEPLPEADREICRYIAQQKRKITKTDSTHLMKRRK